MLRSIQFLQDETDESLDLFENTGTCTKYKKKLPQITQTISEHNKSAIETIVTLMLLTEHFDS